MLTIKEGQKAKVTSSLFHGFPDGITVTFVRNGVFDEDEGFYSYVFTNGVLEQELEADEFELIEE